MKRHQIPYVAIAQQHRPLKKKLLKAIARVMERGDFILGKEVEECEKKVAAYCNVKFAVGVNSGTDALFFALKEYDIGKGDEVITAPNSFLSSASVIVAAGARPVFADVREDMNIDPEKIQNVITSRTKAIIPVHLTGKPADMNPILALAQKRGIYVIEDAAQAMGAEYQKQKVGSLGHVGCFSLHPLKTFNACGDGGIITTNDKRLYERFLQLRNIGLKNRDEADQWGYNSRLDTIQAAILLVKLRYLDAWIEKRRKNAARYRNFLKDLPPAVGIPQEYPEERSVYHTFVIQVPLRDQLQKTLLKAGVETKIHYPIPIHLQKAASGLGYKPGDFPECERQAKMILSLPIYPELTHHDLRSIASIIKDFYARAPLSSS